MRCVVISGATVRHFSESFPLSLPFPPQTSSIPQPFVYIEKMLKLRNVPVGQHTPGGKTYSTTRPVRPNFAGKKVHRAGREREQESEPPAPAQQMATPPSTPQLTTGPPDSSSLQADQEEFRLYMERKRQEEKLARFKMWEEEMERGGK